MSKTCGYVQQRQRENFSEFNTFSDRKRTLFSWDWSLKSVEIILTSSKTVYTPNTLNTFIIWTNPTTNNIIPDLERTFSITNLSKYPGTRQPVLSISERFVDSFYKANPTQQRNSIVSGQNNLKIINLYKKKLF